MRKRVECLFLLQDFQKAYAQLFDLKLIKRIENNEIIFLQDNQYFADLWCSLLIPYLKGYLFICENLVPVNLLFLLLPITII